MNIYDVIDAIQKEYDMAMQAEDSDSMISLSYCLNLVKRVDIPDCADCAKMDPDEALECAAEANEAKRDSYD